MVHEVKKFPLEGKLDGISDSQLSQHRDTLYAGYVNKLNEIESGLETADRSKANGVYSAFGEMKREETYALNGTVLHELYFGNLGGKGGPATGKFGDLVKKDFGSWEKFQEDFKACGIVARGWVLSAYSLYDNKLHNYTLDTHHFHVPVMCIPLLVMDTYEHAYFVDYGVKRAPYLDAFLKNISWDAVNERMKWVEKLAR